MTNRYPGKCISCGSIVPKNGGILKKSKKGRWYVLHNSCQSGRGRSMAITFSSGQTMYQNSRGRCEDAPCCGCCT